MKGSVILSLLAVAATAVAQFDPEQCGPNAGNQKCAGNKCCSQYGWCGTGASYCQAKNGCQAGFGRCTGAAVSSVVAPPASSPSGSFGTSTHTCGPKNGNEKCAPGYCCSQYGYCGKTDSYCSTGCQSGFGQCSIPSSTTFSSSGSFGTSTDKCGPKNGNQKCAPGYCCSQYGYCGKSTSYCSSGCQSGFGQCTTSQSTAGQSSSRPVSSSISSSQSSSRASSTSLGSSSSSQSIVSSSSLAVSSSASSSASSSVVVSSSASSSASFSVASSSVASSSVAIATSSSLSSQSIATSSSVSASSSQASPSPSAPVNRIARPQRDPSVDRNNALNAIPASSLSLFYQETASPGTYTMLIRARFTSPAKAILLENIASVNSVLCSAGQLFVTFSDADYDTVARAWPVGTILLTLADSCNTADERGVYIITGINEPKRRRAVRTAIPFTVSKTTLQDVVDELDISYGEMVSVDAGSQLPSYTTTVTSYFTNSRGTMTSSVFATTITPSVTTGTFTSAVSSTPASSSIVASSTAVSSSIVASSTAVSSSIVATSSASASELPLSPSAQAIMEDLARGLPEPGPDGTISIDIKKGSDAPVVSQPMGSEPFNPDPAYQATLQNAMAADHMDSRETMVNDVTNALADEESNVPADSPIKLGNSDYAGTSDADYDAALPVVVTSTTGNTKRSPASAVEPPAPRTAVGLTDLVQRSNTHSLSKRDGWDTFFEVMGDDLVGEICEICGAISAGKDLYDALKCVFGKCPSPPQRTVTSLIGTTKQEFSMSSSLTKGVIYSDSRATVLCESCYLKVSSLKVEGNVVVMPKQVEVKENFVVSAKFTITQTYEAAALYNMRVTSAGSGSFDRAISTWKLDSVEAPGVVKVTPAFIWGMGLTYDTAQAIDVQAGAVMSLNGAAADIDVKEKAASNVRNFQGSATVTYPKLTAPGRVALSPYLKTDVRLSLTIFGQFLENAVVMTTQTNMGFDATVLTTTEQVQKRSTIPGRPSDNTDMINMITARGAHKEDAPHAALQQLSRRAVTCNAGSMKLNAIMLTKSQAVIGGTPRDLFNQPYKFGSQCIPFAAPVQSSTIRPSTTSTSTRATLPTSTTTRPSLTSSAPSTPESALPPTCTTSSSGFYPPAGSRCFKVVGHGQAFIEGKYLSGGPGSPYLGYQNLPASIYYLDSNGYMYESSTGAVMATDRTDGGAWMSFQPVNVLGSMPRAVCTKSANKGLSCFQTTTSQLSIAGSAMGDSRSNIPMFGIPYSFFQPITLTYEEAGCPASCASTTATPTPAPTPTPSSAPSCVNQASNFYPPTGSSCFKVVGHGVPSAEGKYMHADGGSYPYIGWENQAPSTFYLDAAGNMHEAYMGTVLAQDANKWMRFVGTGSVASSALALCAKQGNGLSCTLNGVSQLTLGVSIPDSRSAIPMFGAGDSNFKTITLTFEDTACPAPCPASTSSSTVPRTSSVATPQPSVEPSSQCSNSLSWVAPSGSTCFTLTGHGPAHIEGQLLSMQQGYSGATLGWGETPAIYTIDSTTGLMYVAGEIGNGWTMSTFPVVTSPWISFSPLSATYEGAPFVQASCSLRASDKTLQCSLKGFNTFIVAPTHDFYSSTDTRSGNPLFGVPDGRWVAMTLTYNQVACPAKCATTTTSSRAGWATPSPSSTSISPYANMSSTATPRPSSASSSALPPAESSVRPTPASSSSSSAPSPTATEALQPCGGYAPGGRFMVAGSNYDVRCGVTGSAPVTRLDVVFMPSFQECMASCNTLTGCRAVMFREIAPVGGAYQCTRYSALGQPVADGMDWTDTFDVGFKV